jgi:tRNA(Ile)-lysidine synthase
MLQAFKDFIESNDIFASNHKVLLAISGGMDSVALADLLHRSKIDFAMAHCNFCLRGEESEGDEEFVKKLSKKYKVPFFTEKFDTKLFAEKEKISIQMAARMLRYAWFEKLRVENNYQNIATAHHQNDVLETVILNFTRGTGISGFHGIKPKSGNIIRPLLFAEKEQIRDYVAENQLGWREDSSNESNKYARNLIRNEVIPLLKKINPSLEETVSQTIEKVNDAESVFFAKVEEIRQTIVKQEKQAIFIGLNISLNLNTTLFFELLKPYNFTFLQTTELLKSSDKQVGASYKSPTHELVLDRNQLVITPKNLSIFSSLEITESTKNAQFGSKSFNLEILPRQGLKINSDKNIALLDADLLTFPLKIRTWKEGDWFIPLGMNGKKKISDLLTDKKVPNNLKSEHYLLTSKESVVWVVGLQLDNRFKITDKTQRVLRITSS